MLSALGAVRKWIKSESSTEEAADGPEEAVALSDLIEEAVVAIEKVAYSVLAKEWEIPFSVGKQEA